MAAFLITTAAQRRDAFGRDLARFFKNGFNRFSIDTHQQASQLQLAVALDGPQLAKAAHTLEGTQLSLDTENGPALYHQVRLHDLQPDTAYVYRVKGAEGWSEWLQFRTAAETFKPFSFIYMGDMQNDILSLASRSVRLPWRCRKASPPSWPCR